MTNELSIREPMRLTAENVDRIFAECLAPTSDDNNIKTNGVRINADFDITKIDLHRDDIIDMLNELPSTFHVGNGDGWTFLNMCMTDAGVQWADFHETCDRLLCLGFAIGACDFTIRQRALWRMFPGEMPYITINTFNARKQ